MITQERLKELFLYADGSLIRRVSTSSRAMKGSVAGSIDKDGYYIIHVDGRKYRAHRLVYLYFNGKHPVNDIDHMDGCRTNNRVENLRDVTRAVNMQNLKGAHKDCSSKIIGAYFDKRNSTHFSSIMKNGERIFIGTFRSAKDAGEAYIESKRVIHAEGGML